MAKLTQNNDVKRHNTMLNKTTLIANTFMPLVVYLPMTSQVLCHAVMSLQNPGPASLAKRREDEASVGSTPLAKQPSNQASDYASSPVKTKTVTGRFASPTHCSTDLLFKIAL